MHLPALVLQAGSSAIRAARPGRPRDERRGVAPGVEPFARRFDADQLDVAVVDERVEDRPSRSSRRPRTRRPSSAAVPSRSSICARASVPMIAWKSRTIRGYGAGPTTEPMM